MVGLLAALRGRDATGRGQKVDVAMLDAILSIMDMTVFGPSIGVTDNSVAAWPGIVTSFQARDGLFVAQVGREAQFERFAHVVGHPEWLEDERFATREGWSAHQEDVIRPAVEAWASGMSALEASRQLAEQGVAAGPSYGEKEIRADPHVRAHEMIVEVPGPEREPVRVHGNPVKFSHSPEAEPARWPQLGQHTEAVLRANLGLADGELRQLREARVIA